MIRSKISVYGGLAAAAIVVGAGFWWLFAPPRVLPDRLVLEATGFSSLPGWAEDDQGGALSALRRSCEAFARLPDGARIDTLGIAGTAADWRPACRAAQVLESPDPARARQFFETWFVPYAATNNGKAEGLFTGYYEPELEGARQPGGVYTVPIYVRPDDLVTVDLGRFRESLKGRRIAGRVVDGALEPYPSREEIDAGALAGRGLELVWVNDPVDAFFLHIQGSGQVRLEGGGMVRVGYAASNGQPYFAIGRSLIERGILTRETVSMQAIRAWLKANPEEGRRLMAENRSFIFFRALEGDGPLGALGVALTPGRSLAVDRRFLPLGVPVWLAAQAPDPDPARPDIALRRLVVAQDTGGAIRGPVRGDVFWGSGRAAESVAGRMKHLGRYWLLLPRGVDPAKGVDTS